MKDKTNPRGIDEAIRIMSLMKKMMKIYPMLKPRKNPEQLMALSQAIDLSIKALQKQKQKDAEQTEQATHVMKILYAGPSHPDYPLVIFKDSFGDLSQVEYPDADKLQAIGYITDDLRMRGESITKTEALNALRWLYHQWTL